MLGDLNELKTFRAILTSGTLTGAARELGTSVAAVSKRLQALERRTMVRLVNRTTRSLSPTEAGSRLLRDVEQALDALSSAEDYLALGRAQPYGTLRVSAPVALGRYHVPPVLGALTERHPGLSISLTLEDRNVDLVGEGFDLAIRMGALSDSSAVMRKIAGSRRILVAASTYLPERVKLHTPADLMNLRLLSQGQESWVLYNERGEKETIAVPGRLRTNNAEVLVDWASAELGIAFQPDFEVAQAIADGRLKHVLPAWSGPSTPIVALYPSGSYLPLKVRVALDALTSRLVPVLSDIGETLRDETGRT